MTDWPTSQSPITIKLGLHWWYRLFLLNRYTYPFSVTPATDYESQKKWYGGSWMSEEQWRIAREENQWLWMKDLKTGEYVPCRWLNNNRHKIYIKGGIWQLLFG